MNPTVRNLNRVEQAAFAHLFKVTVHEYQVRGEVDPACQINRGFVVVDENFKPINISQVQAQAIADEYGVDVRCFNNTFHKSFDTVAHGDPLLLVLQQLENYLSTYGREAIGLKAGNVVPLEALNIPVEAFNISKLVIIREVTMGQAVQLLNQYLATMRAPNDRIRRTLDVILDRATIDPDDIKSFEALVMYCDKRGLVPKVPLSGLRYLVYKTTGSPLVIKNQRTVKAIKAYPNSWGADQRVKTLPAIVFGMNMPGYAAIFLRYKPLFLAFKEYPRCGRIINRLRRMADTYHQPLSEDAVQNYIRLMREGKFLNAMKVLDKASNRDLVKIINACLARTAEGGAPAVFTVRNGRIFVKEDGIAPLNAENAKVYRTCIKECSAKLYARLHDVWGDKVFVVNEGVQYAVPTTEKQMMGGIPFGTLVPLTKKGNFTVGIHWVNPVEHGREQRTDIDLHANSTTRHYGWNGGWGMGQEKLIYSGDNTNAPAATGGAAEAFFVNDTDGEDFIFDVNLFNGIDKGQEFKFFLTSNTRDDIRRDFTFDASKLLAPVVKLDFGDKRHMTLGMLTGKGFYFYDGTLTAGIVPNANYEAAIAGIKNQLDNKMRMSTFLRMIGAYVISPTDAAQLKHDDPEAYAQLIDLTPEALTPATLLNIVDGTVE